MPRSIPCRDPNQTCLRIYISTKYVIINYIVDGYYVAVEMVQNLIIIIIIVFANMMNVLILLVSKMRIFPIKAQNRTSHPL